MTSTNNPAGLNLPAIVTVDGIDYRGALVHMTRGQKTPVLHDGLQATLVDGHWFVYLPSWKA